MRIYYVMEAQGRRLPRPFRPGRGRPGLEPA